MLVKRGMVRISVILVVIIVKFTILSKGKVKTDKGVLIIVKIKERLYWTMLRRRILISLRLRKTERTIITMWKRSRIRYHCLSNWFRRRQKMVKWWEIWLVKMIKILINILIKEVKTPKNNPLLNNYAR